ncbi:CorA family divalent cation transporter [Chloroflexota bacterium]
MDDRYTLISYNPEFIESYSSDSLDDVLAEVREDRISWVIFRGYGPSDAGDIQRLLSTFSADPALSDKILNRVPLEFLDRMPECLYLEYSTPVPRFDSETNRYWEARGSLVLGEGFLLLFDETMLGDYDDIQQKILGGGTRIQSHGSDYLFYLLFRVAVSHSEQLVLGDLVGRFDVLEDRVLASQGTRAAFEELLAAREVIKALYEPLRRKKAALVSIREQDMPFVTDDTQHLFAHNLEADLETLWQGFLRLRSWWDVLLNIHRTTVGQRTSRIIYVLTILSAVFLPITLISSVYATRFDLIPGVDQPLGFYAMLLFMAGIAAGMLGYMKIKGWF